MRHRELIILRTCARCGSEYEWGVHVALFAERAGLGKAEISSTLTGMNAESSLPAQEAALLKAVDQLHDNNQIDDDLWAELIRYFSSAQLLEIVTLTGNYHTIAFVTNAARVELESFAPRFADYRLPLPR